MERGDGGGNTDSHLQNGNLGEIFLLEVGVRDELQLRLEETVERLQGRRRTRKVLKRPRFFKEKICFRSLKQASPHHSAEHAHAFLDRLPGDVSLSDLQGLRTNSKHEIITLTRSLERRFNREP